MPKMLNWVSKDTTLFFYLSFLMQDFFALWRAKSDEDSVFTPFTGNRRENDGFTKRTENS